MRKEIRIKQLPKSDVYYIHNTSAVVPYVRDVQIVYVRFLFYYEIIKKIQFEHLGRI